MKTHLLTDEEFQKTFAEPMLRVPTAEAPPFDFWRYFEAIATADFEHHDCSRQEVECVYRDASGQFEHVLVNSIKSNVFMVLVLDRIRNRVFGHHLLDLNQQYGLER